MKTKPTTTANVFTADGLAIPDGTSKAEWQQIHRTILTCRKASGRWLRQSRAFAETKWGAEFVAQVEIQLELALGIEPPADKPRLNSNDKSSAIVTIEGINQSWMLWSRKMSVEIEGWDKVRLRKCLDLLEPIERTAQRLRELIAIADAKA